MSNLLWLLTLTFLCFAEFILARLGRTSSRKCQEKTTTHLPQTHSVREPTKSPNKTAHKQVEHLGIEEPKRKHRKHDSPEGDLLIYP